MPHIEKTIEVSAPVDVAYQHWTHFEEYPRFMKSVKDVRQVEPRRLHWVTERDGRHEFDSRIVDDIPNRRIAWQSETGARNDGEIVLEPVGRNRTRVRYVMDFDPQGGRDIQSYEKRVEEDLRNYKRFIERSGRMGIAPVRMLTTPHLNPLEWASALLMFAGSLNWGLIATRDLNAIEAIFGKAGRRSLLPRVIYAAIGFSAVYTLFGLLRSEAMTFREQRKYNGNGRYAERGEFERELSRY